MQELNRMAVARMKDGKAKDYAERKSTQLVGENARLQREKTARR